MVHEMRMATEQRLDWTKIHDNQHYYSELEKEAKEKICGLLQLEHAYLFHATSEEKFNRIIDEKKLYASGGCMVASLYSTPAERMNDRYFRLHNLGRYYFEEEVEKKFSLGKPRGLLIEIVHTKPHRVVGLNYLQMGSITYSIFTQIKSQFSIHDLDILTKFVCFNLNQVREFLILTKSLYKNKLTRGIMMNYLSFLNNAACHLTVLGRIIFESISKYIMNHQNDEYTKKCKYYKELNNYNYKNMFFEYFPFLRRNFDTGKIRFLADDFINYIATHHFITPFDDKDFLKTVLDDIICMINKNLLFELSLDDLLKPLSLSNPSILLESKHYAQLTGKILHDILKGHDFMPSIEYHIQNSIRMYWNENNISFLYNDIVPKGEIGLNTAQANKSYTYKIYECNNGVIRNNVLEMQKGERIDDLELVSDIIPYERSSNR